MTDEPLTSVSMEANANTTETKTTDEIPSLRGVIPVTVALCTTLFCLSLDATILATAIPKITTYFDSLDDVAWYGSSYLVMTCALQLLFGKLYKYYPSKWVFLAGLLIFEIGSLICAVAPSSNVLIVGRSIAGLGAAGLFSGSIIIINTAVSLRVRPIYMGVISSMHAVASVAGPIMGGVLTDRLTWRWCFYINLPFGVLAIFFILIFLPSNATSVASLGWREQLKQFDLPGTLFIVSSIICLIFALQWGGSTYSWSDGRIIALFVVAGVTLVIFLGIQVWQKEQATIPLRLIKNRNVWGAVWYGTNISASMFIFTYYLPIWFQAIKNESATESAIHNLPSLMGLVIFAIIGGGLATVIGYYTPLIILSSILTAIGAGLLSTLKVDSGIGSWFGYQTLLAAGVGVGAQNALLVSSVAVHADDTAMTVSILTFTQTLSGAIFLPVAQSVFQNLLSANLRSALPGDAAALILESGATGFRKHLTASQLPWALRAYNKAITQAFYIAVALASASIFGSLVMEWLSLYSKVENPGEEDKVTKGNTVKAVRNMIEEKA